MNSIKVSIVVCAYNEEQYLEQSLQSLLDLNYPKDQYEIIVVDDDSKDRTPKIASKFALDFPNQVTYQRIAHGGLSFARNIGICLSKNEIVAFIDGDAIAHADWLYNLVQPFHNPKVSVVGGIVDNLNSDNEFASFLHHIHYLPPTKGNEQLHHVIGTCMAYRRAYFEAKGGFYYFFDRRGDETTVNQILKDSQDYAIVHDAIVYHERPTDVKSYLNMTIQNGYYSYFSRFMVESVLSGKSIKSFGSLMALNRVFNLAFYPLLILLLIFPSQWTFMAAIVPLLSFLKRHIFSGTVFTQMKLVWSYTGGRSRFINLLKGLYIYLAGIMYSDLGFLKAFGRGTKNLDFNNSIDNC